MRFNENLPEGTHRFAMPYYGWDDEPVDDAAIHIGALDIRGDESLRTEELPFR